MVAITLAKQKKKPLFISKCTTTVTIECSFRWTFVVNLSLQPSSSFKNQCRLLKSMDISNAIIRKYVYRCRQCNNLRINQTFNDCSCYLK